MQIVILGMHRSGTSALCGLLNLTGVYFGSEGEFIKTNEENPKGFWERKDVRHLNDQILHELGCDWSEISHLEQGKLPEKITAAFQEEARSLVNKLQENSTNNIIGLKEPRFCLLMDFWSNILSPDRFFILTHRDAEEIAISLRHRNKIPNDVANYLTEQYLGHAINALQTESCHITSFSKLITDPVTELKAITQAIEDATGVKLNDFELKDAESFISPRLYRSKSTGDSYPISKQLQRWQESLSNGALPEVKSFRTEKASNNLLIYEHKKRFSEFLNLNGRFRLLEMDYFSIKQKYAAKLKLEKAATQREAYVKELEKAATQREARVTELEKTVIQAEARFEKLEEAACRREARIGDLEQIDSQNKSQIAELVSLLDASKAATENTLKLRNQLLDHLNAFQSSTAAQIAGPLYAIENTWPKTVKSIVMLPKLLWWALTFSLIKNMRLHRQAKLLQESDMFDISWYIQRNSDVVLRGVDPIWHWLTSGWREGRDPHPLFNTNWYLAQNPDVLDAGLNPLVHYLSFGASEGRKPSRQYDPYERSAKTLGAARNSLHMKFGTGEVRTLGKREPVRRSKTFDMKLDNTTRADLRRRYTASKLAKKRLVSVILPTYNRAGLISAAIKSVVEQSHKNWELLIVDDGSNDNTASVVSKYKRDKRIKYIKKERGGVCRARNAGLDLAQGELIAFLDSDNSWDNEFIALLVAAIESDDIDIVYSGLRMEQKGEPIGFRGEVFSYAECLKSNYVDLNTLLFKKSVIGQSRFDESIRRMNDWDFLLNVAVKKRVEFVPFIGVSYSFHERADQISELEPQIYKKLIQKRYSKRKANKALMTTQSAFTEIKLDVAILLAAPKEKRNEWGDYHYGTGLAEALQRRGHKTRLYYFQEQVVGPVPDITISLRGLTEHQFPSGTIKVIWSISHPDLLNWREIEECDLLFCASLTWPQMLRWAGKLNAFPLLQCTDLKRFFPQASVTEKDDRVLFVGNSRKADRPIVRHAAESGLNLHIHGTNWEGRVPQSLIKSNYIPNEQLSREYAVASVVLNDHWPSMRDFGYISNRVFDVVASGGVLVSDHLPSIHRVFGNGVSTYLVADDLSNVIDQAMEFSSTIDRTELAAWVNEYHTFQNRADEILDRVEEFAIGQSMVETKTSHNERTTAFRGFNNNLNIGVIPQRSGSSMTSSAFIRLVQPLTSELDDVIVNLARADQQESLQDLDAIIVSRTAFDNLEHAEDFLERSVKQGVPVIVDIDDSFHLMDEAHPQFAEYQPKIEALGLLLESADEIWCSTVPLQESLEPRFGESILLPNSLDPRLWRSYRDLAIPPQRIDDGCLEILYVGSVTHGKDLEMVMPVLDELQKRVTIGLTVIGIAPNITSRPWIRRISPGINSAYPRFAPWLLSHAPLFDVGIAPLTGNPFNEFKSDLKILEYRAMGLVPLASASRPYLDSKAIDTHSLCADSDTWFNRLLALASDHEEFQQQKKSVDDQNRYLWEERSAVDIGNRIVSRLRALAK